MSTKHVVGFSGGIDSQACAGWVLERFPTEDVVEWSKTTHGGKQLALPIVEIEAENGTCSSQYGLCE